jgi:hypothetical protein
MNTRGINLNHQPMFQYRVGIELMIVALFFSELAELFRILRLAAEGIACASAATPVDAGTTQEQ